MLPGHAEESLLCLREIHRFEEAFDSEQTPSKVAWSIYRNFLKSGAAYEISFNSLVCKEIMLQLASPKRGMFDYIKANCTKLLKQDYIEFRKSDAFQDVVKLLKSKKSNVRAKGGLSKFYSKKI